jgi:hypothetical protein
MAVDDIKSPNHDGDHRFAPVITGAFNSFMLMVAFFVVDYYCRFVSPDPLRSLRNWWASPAQLLFFGGIYFIVTSSTTDNAFRIFSSP